jgi:glutaminyl-tRNA synthetase
LHWVSAEHSVPIEARVYDRLFRVERPDLEEGGFEACLNLDSLEVLADSRIEPAAVDPALGERLQFERQGYFFRDPIDSRPDRLVFNRIVPLRDSWAQEVQKQAPTAVPAPPPPRQEPAPKTPEAKVPAALSAEEQELLERLRPELLPVVQAVLAAHPQEVERYRSGQTGILGFLVAQVMKQAAQGGVKPNPKLVNAMLRGELEGDAA